MANPRKSTDSVNVFVARPHALVEELSQVLPKDLKFAVHHLSTPPTATDPLCHPPACPVLSLKNAERSERRAKKPLKTYCEKHFLTISIDIPESKQQVLALALEMYIYTTVYSTIVFVAKADSTGYLSVLKLPKGTPSPIREVTSTFISFLVANRRRKGKQCVVNLFARAQSQYLFPGSVHNKGKHVLDDRGLVRWWCRVLNPLLEAEGGSSKRRKIWERIHGYLIVPGLDDYETRAFLPRSSKAAINWTMGHPLERISPYTMDPSTYGSSIPPRCLIPRYPDDPKARFVQELEESTSQRLRLIGGWTSPKTLDQFWEMMAFRQECSSGRMTGFLWIVFDTPACTKPAPRRTSTAVLPAPNSSFNALSNDAARLQTPEPSQDLASIMTPQSTPSKSTQSTPAKPRSRPKKKIKKVLKGRIGPRQPHIKTHHRTHFPELTETPHYYWPDEGRGQVVLDNSGYKRAVELLLHLEFGTLEAAVSSTARWINEVNVGDDWGQEVVGLRDLSTPPSSASGTGVVNNLSGLIKRKCPAADAVLDAPPSSNDRAGAAVATLGTELIRKKSKVAADATQAPYSVNEEGPRVNSLASGVVRKKPKV